MDRNDRRDRGLADTVEAMYAYCDYCGHFPAFAIYDENKHPVLSWRVAILPFLAEEALFQEFDLAQPWDSPHNLALLSKMPMAYAPPKGKRRRLAPNHTMVHVFVGRHAAFEAGGGLGLLDFPEGPGASIFLVEAGEPVPWTKPEELEFDPDKPLPRMKGLFADGYRVCMGDTSIRWIDGDVSETQVHAAISRMHNPYYEVSRLGVPIR